MKTILLGISICVCILATAAANAQLTISSVQDSPALGIPNIICTYALHSDGWHSWGAESSILNVQGKRSFGNVYSAMYSNQAPSFGFCAGSELNLADGKLYLDLTTYTYQSSFKVQAGDCKVSTQGAYSVTQNLKVSPAAGLSTDVDMNFNASGVSQFKFINYFLTHQDAADWINNLGLMNTKCLELNPGALSSFP